MFTCIMKIMPFSHDLCQELLDNGYTHFVIPSEQNKYDERWTQETMLTFEALRNRPQSNSVPIKHIMDLPAERAKKYYVMVKN
jgi:hypothetical protein